MNIRKITVLCAVLSVCASIIAGCGNSSPQNADGKVSITVGGWPAETDKVNVQTFDMYVEKLAKINPNVNVVPDTTNYMDPKIFQMKAAANQLPTVWKTHLTEIGKTIDSGYAADVTDMMKKKGFIGEMNPDLIKISTKNDKIYAVPSNVYLMGLTINKDLFRKAGLVNEDGTVMVPDTYEQMAEYAKIIKEKTGNAGYAICTAGGNGGWHFMNIAWSYGVKFMEQGEDGRWKATFNTQEAVDALQYVKDLKWKYNALPDTSVIDYTESHKLFGVGQVAMYFEAPSNDYTAKYGFDPANLVMAKMPAGPKGRVVQMGGDVHMFSPSATKEEIEAAFDWMEARGIDKEVDENYLLNYEEECKASLKKNYIIWPRDALAMWVNPERLKKIYEIRDKYTQVDIKDYASYYDTSDVELHVEEPMLCQQLYSVLDGCIQEVVTNENADCAKLIATACTDFQVNHLDKE